jgi:hypothetical protein
MVKEKMKDRELRMVHDSLDRLTEIWNDLPFEDVQHVFRE